MNWNKGYRSSYHMCLVDPDTWADSQVVEITNGSINRVSSGLRESADIGCTDYEHGSDRWIRIFMDTDQEGSHEHTALFTGLTSAPEKTIDGNETDTTLQCYSVLKPAQDILLPIGWYAEKGFQIGEVIERLLLVTPAPVIIEEESPRLSQHIIAEQGETNLTMIDRLLGLAGWRLSISGDGTIRVGPPADSISENFDNINNDSIEPAITINHDWFDCPNVLRVTTDSEHIVIYDDDPESPLSTVSRGREVWREESSVKLGDDESLQTYAERKLKELQISSKEISYDRCYNPAVGITDRIMLHYPAQGLDGIYIVESQKITLDHCATTSEEVKEL